MVILDTHVLAELMRENPDSRVASWIQQIETKNLVLTVIAIAEILRGIEQLPKGKRRERLEQNFKEFIRKMFRGRIYQFYEAAAYLYGGIAACREKAGLSVDPVDLMIAQIAKNLQSSVATCNTKDFEGCGITPINPWQLLATNGGAIKQISNAGQGTHDFLCQLCHSNHGTTRIGVKMQDQRVKSQRFCLLP